MTAGPYLPVARAATAEEIALATASLTTGWVPDGRAPPATRDGDIGVGCLHEVHDRSVDDSGHTLYECHRCGEELTVQQDGFVCCGEELSSAEYRAPRSSSAHPTPAPASDGMAPPV